MESKRKLELKLCPLRAQNELKRVTSNLQLANSKTLVRVSITGILKLLENIFLILDYSQKYTENRLIKLFERKLKGCVQTREL